MKFIQSHHQALVARNLKGYPVNSDSDQVEFTMTMQMFMISSILSNNKNVVQFKNVTVGQLSKLLLQILKILTEIGCRIINNILDNCINRDTFRKVMYWDAKNKICYNI